MPNKLRFFQILTLLFCSIPVSFGAQSETSVLSGRVTDPSGLAVPGAVIRLTRQSTAAVRDTVTDVTGNYRFDLLEPGEYSLRVTAAGFKTFDATAIHLQVALASQLDASLSVGAVEEEVSVQADVSPVNTESIAQGTVISEEKVKALPLNGRQFLQLALLSPAVNSGGIAVQQNVLRQGETAALSVAGARTNDSAYLLDGVINTDPDYNALSYVPSVDAISEFQVQVAQYSAEYGRASGGQINVQTQSGGNLWHGSAWNFLRNNVLDARPFNLTTSSTVPKFQRNQFGLTIGGPIVRNRFFVFFNYEGLRNRQAAANLTTIAVPSLAQRNGNFSEELPTAVIYNPFAAIVNGQRTPFSGNVIPSNLINTQVQAAMLALPQPNLPGNLYINTSDVLQQNYDNYSVRADYAASSSVKLFTRYSGATENASIPGGLPGRPTLDNAIPRNVAIGLTQILSSNKINEVRLGYNRLNFLYGLPEPSFNINGQASQLPNFIIGQLNFGGAGPYNATGPGGVARVRDNTYQLWDVLAWHTGRHSLKLGGELDAFEYVRFEYADPLGSLTFTNGYTNATGAAPRPDDHSGDALATALLGLPQTATRTLGSSRIDGRQYNYAAFVQDDIRLTPAVSANLGLRYEVSPPLHDVRNQMSSIDFTTAPSPQTIFAGGLQGIYSPLVFLCGSSGYPTGCAYTNWKNFSPRAGLVWALNPKTVIRAGGGLYYGTQDDNTLLKLAQTLPTTYAQTLTFNAFVPQNPNLNVFAAAIVGSQAISAAALDPHQGTPYSPQWSLNIQREIGRDALVEIGYLGSGGVHLEQNVQVNNSMPGTTVKRPYFGVTLSPDIQAALRFPISSTTVPVSQVNYFPHSAHSSYNALSLRLEKRYESGFSALSSFTWSKAISNAPQYRNAGGITGSENSPPQNSFNLSADRSLAYFNAKLRSVTSVVYDLPFGTGRRFAATGVPSMILGGWQISSILQMQSGYPFTINYKGDPINIGGGSGGILVRPNQAVGPDGKPIDPNLPSDQRTTAKWFNTAAFVQPIASFGNVGRNSMIGPKMINLDASIVRTFRPVERMAVQFRAEFFNAANHPNFNLIGRIVNDPTFGIVQNQLPPRQIQFALKVSF